MLSYKSTDSVGRRQRKMREQFLTGGLSFGPWTERTEQSRPEAAVSGRPAHWLALQVRGNWLLQCALHPLTPDSESLRRDWEVPCAEHLHPARSPEFGSLRGTESLGDQSHSKTLGCGVSNELLWAETRQCVSAFSSPGEGNGLGVVPHRTGGAPGGCNSL